MPNHFAKSIVVLSAVAIAAHLEPPILDRGPPTANVESESIAGTTDIKVPLTGQEMSSQAGAVGAGDHGTALRESPATGAGYSTIVSRRAVERAQNENPRRSFLPLRVTKRR
jgi:hypothetical protein